MSESVSDNTSDPEALHVPWSSEQAQAWRRTQRNLPLAVIVMAQFGVGGVVTLLAYAMSGTEAAWSAGYGALCAALPSAIWARGLRSALSRANPVAGFMVWEFVKLGLGAALLVAAPQILSKVHWFALLIGLILTLKVVFVAALWPSKVATMP
jgi:ATP synthase protein I